MRKLRKNRRDLGLLRSESEDDPRGFENISNGVPGTPRSFTIESYTEAVSKEGEEEENICKFVRNGLTSSDEEDDIRASEDEATSIRREVADGSQGIDMSTFRSVNQTLAYLMKAFSRSAGSLHRDVSNLSGFAEQSNGPRGRETLMSSPRYANTAPRRSDPSSPRSRHSCVKDEILDGYNYRSSSGSRSRHRDEASRSRSRHYDAASGHREYSSRSRHHDVPSRSRSRHRDGPSRSRSRHRDGPSWSRSRHHDGPSRLRSRHRDGPSRSRSRHRDGPSRSRSRHRDGPSRSRSRHRYGPSRSRSRHRDGPSRSRSRHRDEVSRSRSRHRDGPSRSRSRHRDGPSRSRSRHRDGPSRSRSRHRDGPSRSRSRHRDGPSRSRSRHRDEVSRSRSRHRDGPSRSRSRHRDEVSRSRSRHSAEASRSENRGWTFPLPQDVFQRELFNILFDIRNRLTSEQPIPAVVHIDKMETMEDFVREEERLSDPKVFETFVLHVSRIGGKNTKDFVNKVLDRLFTNALMAKFNMKGKGKRGKKPLENTMVYKAIKDGIMTGDWAATEDFVRLYAAEHLKHAPHRSGGRGRQLTED